MHCAPYPESGRRITTAIEMRAANAGEDIRSRRTRTEQKSAAKVLNGRFGISAIGMQPPTSSPRPAAGGIACKSARHQRLGRSEEHTSELQSLMRSSYAVFCLKKKNQQNKHHE